MTQQHKHSYFSSLIAAPWKNHDFKCTPSVYAIHRDILYIICFMVVCTLINKAVCTSELRLKERIHIKSGLIQSVQQHRLKVKVTLQQAFKFQRAVEV